MKKHPNIHWLPQEEYIVDRKRGYELGYTGWKGSMEHTLLKCPACGYLRWRVSRDLKERIKTGYCKKCQTKLAIGEKNSNWRGGRYIWGGYVFICLPENDFFTPMRDVRGYIPEHRLVMAQYLRRCLLAWEVVHHKNGIRNDNRIENLELIKGRDNHHAFNLIQKELKRLQKENEILKRRLSLYETQ